MFFQGVALLPFVDEKRLHKALEPYYTLLTPAEIKRNVRGDDRLYLPNENSTYKFLLGLYNNDLDPNLETDVNIDGMHGKVLLSDDNVRQVKQFTVSFFFYIKQQYFGFLKDLLFFFFFYLGRIS